jgi:hypothetical protein
MEWNTLLAAYGTLLGIVIGFGTLASQVVRQEVQQPVGTWLSETAKFDLKSWLRASNEFFRYLFDKLYVDGAKAAVPAIWTGLLLSFLVSTYINLQEDELRRFPLLEAYWSYIGERLLITLGLAVAISLSYYLLFRFSNTMTPEIAVTWIFVPITLSIIVPATLLIAIIESVDPLTLILRVVGMPLAMYFVGRFLVLRLSDTLSINPLKVLATSLVSLVAVGLFRPGEMAMFLQEFRRDGPPVLGFLSLNLFADAFSLLET